MTVVTLPVRRRLDRPPNRSRWILRRRTSTVEDAVRLPPQPAEPAPSVVVLAYAREVRRDGVVVPFTRIEFDLLMFLATHPRQVFTREQLLHHVWGFSRGGLRTVDVHIRRLRAKLPDRPLVVTVRGVGYRLADEADVRVIHLPPSAR
ncbi:MAG: response regulator transcription factor [Micromonosporaceae bacterium]|nr:response regulator transcription factor [Micromonosporaceae bacterium]